MDRQAARDVNIVGPVNDNGILVVSSDIGEALKDGDVYFLAETDDSVVDDGKVEYLVQTAGVDVSLFGQVTSTANTIIRLFEDAEFSAAGSAQTLFNANRNSIKNSSITVTKAPTLDADGNRLTDNFISGGEKNQAFGGSTGSPIPLILKKDTVYLLRITNISGSTAAINVGLGVLELV